MDSLENFIEINRYLISNRIILCKFRFKKEFSKKKKNLYKNSKQNLYSVARIPFWMGKIFNLSSFCRLIIPSFLRQGTFRKMFTNSKIGYLEIFLKKFFFLAINFSKILEKKFINKILKIVFLEKFSNLNPEIKKIYNKNLKEEKFNFVYNIYFFLFINFSQIFFLL